MKMFWKEKLVEIEMRRTFYLNRRIMYICLYVIWGLYSIVLHRDLSLGTLANEWKRLVTRVGFDGVDSLCWVLVVFEKKWKKKIRSFRIQLKYPVEYRESGRLPL